MINHNEKSSSMTICVQLFGYYHFQLVCFSGKDDLTIHGQKKPTTDMFWRHQALQSLLAK